MNTDSNFIRLYNGTLWIHVTSLSMEDPVSHKASRKHDCCKQTKHGQKLYMINFIWHHRLQILAVNSVKNRSYLLTERLQCTHLVCQYEKFLALSKFNHVFDVLSTKHLACNEVTQLTARNGGAPKYKIMTIQQRQTGPPNHHHNLFAVKITWKQYVHWKWWANSGTEWLIKPPGNKSQTSYMNYWTVSDLPWPPVYFF